MPAYLVSGEPGWKVRRMTQIYDLSDPAHPVFIRDFGLPGQQPGSTGPAPTELHGPMSTGPSGNRVYPAAIGRGYLRHVEVAVPADADRISIAIAYRVDCPRLRFGPAETIREYIYSSVFKASDA